MTSLHFESIGTISDSVRTVETEDGAVLLDIRQRLCLSLNPEAARIWDLLKLNYSLEQITACLRTELSLPAQQVHEEIVEFVNEVTRLGLLDNGERDSRTSCRQWIIRLIHRRARAAGRQSNRHGIGPLWLFGKAVTMLQVFDLLRLRRNIVELYEFVQNWPVSHGPAVPDAIDRVCKAVSYACVFYPKWVRCLQRSATTTCLLRSLGVNAAMVIGAQKVPFDQHAWTEVDGRVIDEQADIPSTFLVLDRL
jgi:transglutaminase superfamily protein/coenzyme PQQ synthesis protein D (PqqD)